MSKSVMQPSFRAVGQTHRMAAKPENKRQMCMAVRLGWITIHLFNLHVFDHLQPNMFKKQITYRNCSQIIRGIRIIAMIIIA